LTHFRRRHDMPIRVGAEIRPLTLAEFKDVDFRVIGFCQEIHNRLGRLCEEKCYQNELLHRCKAAELLPSQKEVPVTLSFGTFEKRLFIDLLVFGGAIFELKTVEMLTADHQSQLYNYMFLAGLKQGKLINMAGESVDGTRLLTPLDESERKRFSITCNSDEPRGEKATQFRELVADLLRDWGGYLSPHLYAEAIGALIGTGREPVRIEMVVEDRTIGRVSLRLLDARTALEVSSVTTNPRAHERHLRRLLTHTHLETIEWVNLSHHDVHFRTIKR